LYIWLSLIVAAMILKAGDAEPKDSENAEDDWREKGNKVLRQLSEEIEQLKARQFIENRKEDPPQKTVIERQETATKTIPEVDNKPKQQNKPEEKTVEKDYRRDDGRPMRTMPENVNMPRRQYEQTEKKEDEINKFLQSENRRPTETKPENTQKQQGQEKAKISDRDEKPRKDTQVQPKTMVGNDSTQTRKKKIFYLSQDKITLEMSPVPAGTFLLGSPEEEPGHETNEKQHEFVLLKEFWIGKNEVTQAQFEAIMGYNPSLNPGDKNRPVENVTWQEAKKYCEKLNKILALPSGYRFDLPTKEQWEYACRAGTKTSLNNEKNVVAIGSNEDSALDEVGWYDKNSGNMTHPVKAKKANRWGLYDMHGNVAEWCQDQWSFLNRSHVFRGGHFRSMAQECRSAYYFKTKEEHDWLGFRVVLVPEQ